MAKKNKKKEDKMKHQLVSYTGCFMRNLSHFGRTETNLQFYEHKITISNFFYCCTVHFDNIKILFNNKYNLLLSI